jgi:hypothetical protein
LNVAAIIDWNAITAQGPLFWAACGSVALGVAMIAAASVAQARRLGKRSATREAAPADPAPEAPAAVSVAVESRPVAAPQPAGQDPTRRRLADLLDRLERVAATLESLEPGGRGPAPSETTSAGESSLKEPGGGVEYVFRAAGG